MLIRDLVAVLRNKRQVPSHEICNCELANDKVDALREHLATKSVDAGQERAGSRPEAGCITFPCSVRIPPAFLTGMVTERGKVKHLKTH